MPGHPAIINLFQEAAITSKAGSEKAGKRVESPIRMHWTPASSLRTGNAEAEWKEIAVCGVIDELKAKEGPHGLSSDFDMDPHGNWTSE
jgi:hypothetical protein